MEAFITSRHTLQRIIDDLAKPLWVFLDMPVNIFMIITLYFIYESSGIHAAVFFQHEYIM